jgi:hypothetical protein
MATVGNDMTELELLQLAIKVRTAQKKYFKSRDFHDLDESKKLEREFDAATADIASGQGSLLT